MILLTIYFFSFWDQPFCFSFMWHTISSTRTTAKTMAPLTPSSMIPCDSLLATNTLMIEAAYELLASSSSFNDTISINTESNKRPAPRNNNNPTKRRVTFNTSSAIREVRNLSTYTEEEKRIGWWQKEEYENCRSKAKNVCKAVRRAKNNSSSSLSSSSWSSASSSASLTENYRVACQIADDTDNDDVMMESSLSSCYPSHVSVCLCVCSHQNSGIILFLTIFNFQQQLVQWCTNQQQHNNDSNGDDAIINGNDNNDSPRGLERWCSKVHGYLRGKHVGECKHAVLLEQARAANGATNRIAQVSSRYSKRSRAFARMLGQADAMAVAATTTIANNNNNKRPSSVCCLLELRPSKIQKVSSITSDEGSVDADSSPMELLLPKRRAY